MGNEGNGILIRLTVLTYESRFSALAYGISGFKIQICILRNTVTFEITPSNVTLNIYSALLNSHCKFILPEGKLTSQTSQNTCFAAAMFVLFKKYAGSGNEN